MLLVRFQIFREQNFPLPGRSFDQHKALPTLARLRREAKGSGFGEGSRTGRHRLARFSFK